MTKTSGCDGCNDAGAISQQRITAGDGCQFVAGATGPLRTAGLTQSFTVSSPGTIVFGVRFQSNIAEVREGGVYRADISYVAGDAFRIAIQSGVVRYSKNGTVFYTSRVAPAYPLVLAAALANRNGVVGGATIGGTAASGSSGSGSSGSGSSGSGSGSGSSLASVTWSNPVNVTAVGNSLRKTSGCDGCNDAGAPLSSGSRAERLRSIHRRRHRAAARRRPHAELQRHQPRYHRLRHPFAGQHRRGPRKRRLPPGRHVCRGRRVPDQGAGGRGELFQERDGVLHEHPTLELAAASSAASDIGRPRCQIELRLDPAGDGLSRPASRPFPLPSPIGRPASVACRVISRS